MRRARSSGIIPSIILVLALAVLTAPAAFVGASFVGVQAWAAETEAGRVIDGFRSAKFGMTEDDVKKAARKDFKVKDDDIKSIFQPIEKTPTLHVTVNGLIPGGGPATVVYIFGYQSKKLIQVSILWGPPANPTPDSASLIVVSNILRNYFERQGFPADSVLRNKQASDGSVIVYRAMDEKKRVVSLQLKVPERVRLLANGDLELGARPEEPAETAAPGQAWLRLAYIVDTEKPDVYQLMQGEF